jgi:hypothetical protein
VNQILCESVQKNFEPFEFRGVKSFHDKIFQSFQYSGTWFEIERYQQQDESEADCMSSQYSWGFISRSFRIDRNGKDLTTSTPFRRNATGLLSFPDASPTLGLLNITYYADRGMC